MPLCDLDNNDQVFCLPYPTCTLALPLLADSRTDSRTVSVSPTLLLLHLPPFAALSSTMVVTLSGDRAQVDEKTAAAFIHAVGVYLEELAMTMV